MSNSTPLEPPSRRVRVGARVVAFTLAGLGGSLFDAWKAAHQSTSIGLAIVHVVTALSLGVLVFNLAGLPWTLGALSPWHLDARDSADHPPVIAWALALACTGAGAIAIGRVAFRVLTWSVAPRNVTPLGIFATVAAFFVLAGCTPLLASLFAKVVPTKRKYTRILIFVAIAAALIGTRFAHRVDARITSLPLAALALLTPFCSPKLCTRLLWAPAIATVLFSSSLAFFAWNPPTKLRGPIMGTFVTAEVFSRFERWTDDDHDGHGDHFGGIDCDDQAPFIFPGARDLPDNGIDENCDGVDATNQPYTRTELPRSDGSIRLKSNEQLPHIVLLVIDALRFEQFGHELTPHLNEWRDQGTEFTRTQSTASSTRYAIPSIFFGRWMSHTNYSEAPTRYYLDSYRPTLTSLLKAHGYSTLAVLPPFVATRLSELKIGFDRYEPFLLNSELKKAEGQTAPFAVQKILKMLNHVQDRPVFIYLHVDDPHIPYSKTNLSPEFLTDERKDLYRGEIARMDNDLVPFLDRLREMEKTRPVLLAVTADHGESFEEHGTVSHGYNLYQEVLHIPLFFYGFQVPPHQRLETPVDLLDVSATLAEAGGVQLPGAQGQSLYGVMQGQPWKADRPLFSEMRLLHPPYPNYASVLQWPYKLIHRLDTNAYELYNLIDDPGETIELSGREPQTLQRMRDTLTDWKAHGQGVAGQLRLIDDKGSR